MTDPNQWQYEQKRAVVERAHDDERDFGRSADIAAVSTGSNALRGLLLINGGAAIAMLAFIGHLISSDKGVFAEKDTIKALINLTTPLSWFAGGVACAAASMALGYLANFSMGRVSSHRIRTYEDHPYVRPTKLSKRWGVAVGVFQAAAVAGGFFSLFLFVWGIWEVRDVISALPTAPVTPAVTPAVTPK